MKVSEPFFDLQLRFAERVVELSGMSLAQALLDYTNLYVRFGLGRDFDAENPVWRDFLAGLPRENRAAWTYRFFQSRPPNPGPPSMVATFGCFSYARLRPDCMRLHFENAEPDGVSPLSTERRAARQAEMRALIAHARTQRGVTRVAGASWLYNLDTYRRLFPASYLATAKPAENRFRNMPLWGQFLDRDGGVRSASAALFVNRLSHQDSMDRLVQCFPLQPLALEAPLTEF